MTARSSRKSGQTSRESSRESRRPEDPVETTQRKTAMKPPKAPIPVFQPEQGGLGVVKLLSEFENVMSKFEYTDFEQFILLKQNLRGDPLKLAQTLGLEDQHIKMRKNF